MRFSFGLFLLAGTSSVIAQQASSSAPVPVTGSTQNVNTQTGQRPSRLNINDLYASGAPWDLYIQAMVRWQSMSEDDELSFFQVMGIHGLPFVSWNGVGNVNGGGGGGYCPHNEILFATWHRPFLALAEQEVAKHAMDIANEYTGSQKTTYVNAAKNLRLPFWDWASSPSLPSIVTQASVNVNTPSGKKSFTNPLLAYKFKKWPFTYPNFGGTIAQYRTSMRCPTTNNDKAAQNTRQSTNNLRGDGDYLKQAVYLTLTQTTTFDTMSTDASSGSSFETPHNTVHNDIGCGNPTGHMTNLGWSAFDPVFLLHHANVDRLIAMWQAINYNHAMFAGTKTTNSAFYGTPRGYKYTADYPLKPFRKDTKGNMWTSNGVRSTRAFGYTYPELPDWTMSQSQLASSVRSKVNQLYSGSSSSRREVGEVLDDRSLISLTTQYIAEISVDREEVPLPCNINLYLNGTKAGSMAVLSMPKTGKSFSVVPLQQVLQDTSLLGIVRTALVPLIHGGMHVEIQSFDGTITPVRKVPSLSVTLEVLEVQPRVNEFEFPKYVSLDKKPISLHII